MPLVLLHMPVFTEILHGRILPVTGRGSSRIPALLESLQRHTDRPVVSLLSSAGNRKAPADFTVLPPYDSHPTLPALRYYADIAAELIAQDLAPADR